MAISRRDFLKNGVIAAAAVGSSLTVSKNVFGQKNGDFANAVQTSESLPFDLLAQRNKETFSQFLGTSFFISGQARRASFTLSEVRDLQNYKDASYAPSGTRESFRLLFQGSRDALPEGTYSFAHDALGSFDLFISPAGMSKGINFYQAHFNRV